MKKFLNKIQTGSDAAKIGWLILFSGIAMVLVVFFWLKYLDSIIADQANSQQQISGQQTKQDAGQNFAFWQTLKAGFGIIFQWIADTFHSVFNMIREPKSYMIKP